MYIKTTLFYYFGNINNVHYEVVYMDGKSKFSSKDKIVKQLIKSYKSTGNSAVFLCIDLDNWQTNPEDRDLNHKIEEHCKNNHYHLAWFNKNIEHVFLKEEHVESKKKKEEAIRFVKSNIIENINKDDLMCNDEKSLGKSNLLSAVSQFYGNT